MRSRANARVIVSAVYVWTILGLAAGGTAQAPAAGGSLPARLPEVPRAAFKSLCSGHVTGANAADGSPGPHIEWTAYSSPSTTEALVKLLASSLHGAARETHETCVLWRFTDPGRQIWDLCPVDIQGPASECAQPPAGTKSILIVSSMVGGS